MAVTFRVFPARGVVFVRYSGFVGLAESAAAFDAYAMHPDFRPGQKQLVDLSGITGWERDYVTFLAMQAHKAGVLLADNVQTLMVFHAPTPVAREFAQTVLRSWEPSGAVIPMMQETEAEALRLLDQPETRFEDLLQKAT